MAHELNVPNARAAGINDPEVPQQEVRELVSRLPDAQLVTLPRTSHMLPLINPGAVIQHVTRWVRHVRHVEA